MHRLGVLILLSLLALQTKAVPRNSFFNYGDSTGDIQLPRAQVASTQLQLDTQVRFLGSNFDSIYVTSNGILSLGQDFTGSPGAFPSNHSLIAPFWTSYNYSETGQVYYRQSTEFDDVSASNTILRNIYGTTILTSSVVVVTWEDMTGAGSDETNTFQAVLATSGTRLYVVFYYLTNGMHFAGTPYGQIGVASGDQVTTIPLSNTESVLDIVSLGNTGTNGQWVWELDTQAHPLGVIIGWESSTYSVDEGLISVQVCVSLFSGTPPAPFTVSARTEPGSADRHFDFVEETYRFQFEPSTTDPVCDTVRVVDDGTLEDEEYFTLNLQSVSVSGQSVVSLPRQTTVAIQDNEVVVVTHTNSILTVSEGDDIVTVCSGLEDTQGNLILTTQKSLRVGIATRPGTALENEDFVAVSGREIMFPRGMIRACTTIAIQDDEIFENEEMFYVTLSELADQRGVIVNSATMGTVMIQDNDGPTIELEFDQTSYTVAEGESLTACVTMTAGVFAPGSSFDVVVQTRYPGELIQGTTVPADIGDDYIREAVSFTFTPDNIGESHCITVSTIEDNLYEGTELFGFVVTSEVPLTIDRPRVTVFLNDNDEIDVSLIRREFEFQEGQTSSDIRVCANRTGVIQRPLTVQLVPHLVTASFYNPSTRSGDVRSQISDIVFDPLATTACTSITILDDYVLEEKVETFTVGISHPDPLIFVRLGSATISIRDNDFVIVRFFNLDESMLTVDENSVVVPRICITRIGASDIPVSVFLNPVSGTATEHEDYEAEGKSLEFQPTSHTNSVECPSISLTLLDDLVVEGNEEVLLELMSEEPDRIRVANIDGNPQAVTLTILEDDEVFASFTDRVLSVSEGDGGIEVCLAMRGYSVKPFTVYVSTNENTAREGIDFVPQTVAIQFPPTNASLLSNLYALAPNERITTPLVISEPQCARISIIDDGILEEDGSKILVLTVQENDTYVRLEDPQSVIVNIQDDDFVTVDLETNIITVPEGIRTASVCARIIGQADFDIDVELETFPGTAVPGFDYTTKTAPLRFPALSTESQCAEFSVNDDTILEESEEFTVLLSIVTVNVLVVPGTNNSVTVVIMDDDFVTVEFQERDYSHEEGGSVEVCAQMTGSTVREVPVTFSTRPSQDGVLAVTDVDYISISNVTFFEGVTPVSIRTQCISITLPEDAILENTESFQVVLSSPDSGVRITSRSVADVYILDNDGVRMGIQEREYHVEETQKTQSVCVELVGRIEKNIGIELTTRPLTATGDRDYTTVSSMPFMFQASESSNQTICSEFTILDDTIYETTESFEILFTVDEGTTGVSINIPRATVFIMDNDDVSVGFQSTRYEVSEGTGSVQVCLMLTGTTETEVECGITTEPGTATQSDYSFSDAVTLTFPATFASGLECTSITITDDSILEPTEQFTVLTTNDMPRVSVSPNETIVSIIDDDRVSVGFLETFFNVSEDLENERNITLCVELSGEIEKDVSVMVSTQSSDAPLEVATAGHDYQPLEVDIVFVPGQNKTHCVVVTVFDDRLVEPMEMFDVIIATENIAVTIPESSRKATVSIYDEDVVCEKDGTDTSRGFFDWPVAFPNEVERIPCINGTAARYCDSEGNWGPPEVDGCYASIDSIFKHIFKNLPDDETGLSVEFLRELIEALLQLREDEPEGLNRFLDQIYTIYEAYARNVTDDVVPVHPEVYELTYVVADILHHPEWPRHILYEESTRLIQSLEYITEGLLKTDGFERVKLNNTFLGHAVEKGTVDDLLPSDPAMKKTVVFENIPKEGVVARLFTSPPADLQGAFLSSITLPGTISEQLTDNNLGLYFAYYDKSVMFPIANSPDVNRGTHSVSSVIMATVSRTTIQNLKDNVNYTIAIGHNNYSNPVCVSWDFTAAEGVGNWTDRGCKLQSNLNGVVMCSCSHLTNFAVLLDVRPISPTDAVVELRPILSIILIVGVGISLLGLTLTVITLLLFSKLRKRDTTVLRIQFCLSVALMLLAFVCGIERVEIFELCVSISALIHYFTLVSLMWMAAEALLMVSKLIITAKTSIAFFVIASIICWLLPVPAVVVPIGIDRNFSIHESYCFISHNVVFYAAFLGPIAAILIFNLIVFFLAFIVILRYSSKKYKGTVQAHKRRAAVRTIFTVLAVMCLFGLTWTFGAFTVLRAPVSFEYLFVIFNAFQGLFTFLIFVVFAKETRTLWLVTCGCRKKVIEELEEIGRLSRRVSRNPSLRKTDDDIDLDSDVGFDFDGADRLEALKALDRNARLNMNSWDVMYIMPQNTFDIFLNSDQFQPTPTPQAAAALPSTTLPSHSSSTSPTHATHTDIREDQSTADSGIQIDQQKSVRSPKRLMVGEPVHIPTLEESEKRSGYHVHSISGTSFLSTESDDDFLDRASPPVLAAPPNRRMSRAYGDLFQRELNTRKISTSSQDLNTIAPEVVVSDIKVDISQQ